MASSCASRVVEAAHGRLRPVVVVAVWRQRYFRFEITVADVSAIFF
jgi:hypothetical protein